MNNKKPSKFGLGLLFGTVFGALAGIFLAPKSGKENREAVLKKMKQLKKQIDAMELDKKVKEVFGEVTEEGKMVYSKARKELVKKLDLLEDKWEEFDKEKYIMMVEEVIEDLKKETPKLAHKLVKLKDGFVKDWNDVFA